ncbi:hypothetical protein AVEN_255397-1 [Araneus ventricosus]|uniref:Uncharacterized protein n=1 Tax=Araneus ventricosus TaxID=182803 RepID=A0A4Y2HTG1_ARAVE|nr:hypothetical protein AVEN_255397-1 [Araneus ventricosus]
MPEEIIESAKITNILTGLTPDATSAKIQPEGIDSSQARHVETIVSRLSSFSVLEPSVKLEMWPQKVQGPPPRDPFYAPAGRAIHSLIFSTTERPRLLPGKRKGSPGQVRMLDDSINFVLWRPRNNQCENPTRRH